MDKVELFMVRLSKKWLLLLVLIMLVALLRVGFERELFALDWNYTHYLFNYEDEFVKRGLVGEVLRWLPWGVTRNLIQKAAILITALGCVMLCSFFVLLFVNYRSLSAFVLVLIASLSPVTILHFIFDVGRFDALVYSLLSLILLNFVFIKKNSYFFDGVLVMLIVFLALLIHEAAFFMIVPLLLACWHVSDGSAVALRMQISAMVFSVVATFLISVNGDYSLLSLDEHFELLQGRYGDWVARGSLLVLHHTGFSENLSISLRFMGSLQSFKDYYFFILCLSPLWFLLFGLLRVIFSLLSKGYVLVLLSSLSPLLLCFLGVDHFRWFSLAVTNFFIGLFFIFLRDQVVWRAAQLYIIDNLYLAGLVVLMGLALGAVGVAGGFEVLEYFLNEDGDLRSFSVF